MIFTVHYPGLWSRAQNLPTTTTIASPTTTTTNTTSTTTPEETSTFLSDSSLDGASGGLREEEEEEEEDEEDEEEERALGNYREELKADSEVGAEDLRGSPSPVLEAALKSQEEGGSRSNRGGGGRAETNGEVNNHCDRNEEDAAMEQRWTPEKKNRSTDARCDDQA